MCSTAATVTTPLRNERALVSIPSPISFVGTRLLTGNVQESGPLLDAHVTCPNCGKHIGPDGHCPKCVP